jgi:hypothetical protein
MAHILYRLDGRPVSLFVLPTRWVGRQGLNMMGHEAVLWRAGGRTFALIGREAPDQMERIALYMRRASN